MTKDVKWSSKIEISYITNDYKKMFRELEAYYEDFGQFHPYIANIYDNCFHIIRIRVLREILTAYHSISFDRIRELSAIN
jgi:hypothetical protein